MDRLIPMWGRTVVHCAGVPLMANPKTFSKSFGTGRPERRRLSWIEHETITVATDGRKVVDRKVRLRVDLLCTPRRRPAGRSQP